MKKKLKRYKSAAISQKSYISLFIFFFVIGILWGKFFYYNEDNRRALFKKPRLELLAEAKFLPTDVIESFALENNVEVSISTYKNKEELATHLQKRKYDLIAFKSYYAQDVLKALAGLNYSEISNEDAIAVDFKNPPYDPDNKLALPLFWGVDKNAKSEKSLLWIESLGVTKNSKYKELAYDFLDYVLQTEVAQESVQYRKVASTNKNVEKSKNIDSNFKPSFLRKISIRNLAFDDKAGF